MILPDLLLTTRANQHWQFSGMDSLEQCQIKNYFKSYPYTFDYVYNSRGFRDVEWPNDIDQLKTAIWCVGDSFTEGMGCPADHAWPYILKKRTSIKTINVSMDGASNTWIARKTVDILKEINPEYIILHWSYLHRREISQQEIWEKEADRGWRELYTMFREPGWPDCETVVDSKKLPDYMQEKIASHWVDPSYTDEERRRTDTRSTIEQDLENFNDCLTSVNAANQNTKIIHSFIPNFTKSNNLQSIIESILPATKVVPYFDNLDLARDGHHYDIKTATHLVNQLIKLI